MYSLRGSRERFTEVVDFQLYLEILEKVFVEKKLGKDFTGRKKSM